MNFLFIIITIIFPDYFLNHRFMAHCSWLRKGRGDLGLDCVPSWGTLTWSQEPAPACIKHQVSTYLVMRLLDLSTKISTWPHLDSLFIRGSLLITLFRFLHISGPIASQDANAFQKFGKDAFKQARKARSPIALWAPLARIRARPRSLTAAPPPGFKWLHCKRCQLLNKLTQECTPQNQ